MSSLGAQEIIPAVQFFNSVSEQYGKIQDYQADMTIILGEQRMTGAVFYKTPNLLRINFTKPSNQVIVVNGEKLMIYLPRQSVTMTQSVKRHSERTLTAMAAGQGLHLMSRRYSIGYLDSPDYVPLEEGSLEEVIKLRLVWRSTAEGFRQIVLSIGKNGFIRRLEAVTKEYRELRYDLMNIQVNQGIPSARFNFDPPPSSYTIDNFLFEPED